MAVKKIQRTTTNVVTGEVVATGDTDQCCGWESYDWACF